MPFAAAYPSICMNDRQNLLFVCGGWWNDNTLPKCHRYDFVNNNWIELQKMNHSRVAATIYLWEKIGNKIIIAGGHGDNFYIIVRK